MTNREETGELRLWKALLDLMIHDLGSKDLDIREEAEDWFCPLNPDFVFVCELIDLQPKKVLDFVEQNRYILESTDNLKTKIRRLRDKYTENTDDEKES